MKILTLLTASALASACYSETETHRVMVPQAAETGQVVQVDELVQRRHGHPIAGAVAGALLGGVIFHSGTAAVIGGGLGAVASADDSTRREYEVTVRFDNGELGRFDFGDWSPFRPGDRVVLDGDQLQRL